MDKRAIAEAYLAATPVDFDSKHAADYARKASAGTD